MRTTLHPRRCLPQNASKENSSGANLVPTMDLIPQRPAASPLIYQPTPFRQNPFSQRRHRNPPRVSRSTTMLPRAVTQFPIAIACYGASGMGIVVPSDIVSRLMARRRSIGRNGARTSRTDNGCVSCLHATENPLSRICSFV